MRLEGDLVSVHLDEKKQGRIVSFLMDVESVAARFRVVAHPRVAQQAFAKSINDILTYAQMCGMEDWHGGHPLAVLPAESSWPPLPVTSAFSNCIACRTLAVPQASSLTHCDSRWRACRRAAVVGNAADDHAQDLILRRFFDAARTNEPSGLEHGDAVAVLEHMVEVVANE